MINLLYFRIKPDLREQIENFTGSTSSEAIIFHHTDDLDEFSALYAKNYFDIVIVDASADVHSIISLLKKTVVSISKLIVFSSNRNDAFEFINFNVFGFLEYPLDAVKVVTIINRCLNKITAENDAFQFKFSKEKFQNFVSINSVKKIELIKTGDISHFEADGRYTIVYLNNGTSKIASKNIGEFQKLLNPDIFCRIHHKFIINMNNLLNILKSDGYYCEMANNRSVPVSKRKLENLNLILNLGKTFA